MMASSRQSTPLASADSPPSAGPRINPPFHAPTHQTAPEGDTSRAELMRRGYILYGSCQYGAAIAYFNRAINLAQDALALHGRGLAQAKVGDYEAAVKDFRQALKLCSDDAQLWYNCGMALSGLGHHRWAISCFNQSIRLHPCNHHTWYNRSRSLRACRHYQAALENLNRTIQLKPDCHYAWRYRGFVLSAMKRYPEAIASFSEALKLKEPDLIAWYGKAQAAVRLNDIESAIHCLHQTFRLNPVGYQQLVRSRREFDPVRSDGRFIDLISNLA